MNFKFDLSIYNNYHVPVGPKNEITNTYLPNFRTWPLAAFRACLRYSLFYIKIYIFDFWLQGWHWVSECAEKGKICAAIGRKA